MEHTPEDVLTDIPQYKVDESLDMIEKGASRLSVRSSDPDAYKGLDTSKIAAYQSASAKAFVEQRRATQANKVSWNVASAAGAEWAAKVFPDLETEEEQVDALWDAIFRSVHLYEDDPVAYWQEKDKILEEKATELNEEAFTTLHYRAPGTDLKVGLPKNHLWGGAGSFNARGERFIANMPTEEVFGAPDSTRIEGTVASTKPLSYGGVTIDGMSFTFEDGKVVDFSAEENEDVLKHLLETDEGAKSLGEVALVPDDSPISNSGLIFFNTLFDENASNHLALGSAYAFSIEGGESMSEEELKELGLNRSNIHVDFMIGSDQMDIDGIKEDGTRIAIFRNGDWA
jgi:aminopeptidase